MHTFNSTHTHTNIEPNAKVELASDTVIYKGRYAILCHKTTLSADATLHASFFFPRPESRNYGFRNPANTSTLNSQMWQSDAKVVLRTPLRVTSSLTKQHRH